MSGLLVVFALLVAFDRDAMLHVLVGFGYLCKILPAET